MSIKRHTDLDFKKLNYKKPEKQGLIYYSAIDYNNEPFYLQTPKMICKKGALENKSNLEMEPMNIDFSFYDTFVTLDELNIKKTFENNKDWFGKDIPLEVIDNMYKRSTKPVKKDSKPIFTFKIPMIKSTVQCQIYDQKRTCVDLMKLKEGTEIVCILHMKGLKFLKQHYYCDVYISQIKVFLEGDNKYTILDSYSFNDEGEEEEELKELEKDLMLDDEFLMSIQNKENEKKLLIDKLALAKEILNKQESDIITLETQLSGFN
jgi:riboflavin synthase|tara:strand:+ start:1146 stop:1934 length:789 start_codon:yes stop_codon:yes gene_type:complete